MATNKSVVVATALVGASVLAADAFVAPGAPSQHQSTVALRGASQQPSQSAMPSPSAMMAAASAAVLGASSASASKRRCTQKFALRATAVAETPVAIEEAAPPPPPPFNPAEQIGAIAPLGFFDPMGFTPMGDEATFRQMRAAEIKHGRVAMMASIGAIGQHFIRFPGFENCTGTFGAALQGAGTLGLFFLTVSLSVLELAWRDDPEKEAGNFGNPFGIELYNDEWRTKEISNGRMAMISVLGIWGAEVATGKDAIQQFGFGALPRSQVVSTASSFAGASASAITALRGKPLAATAVAEAPEAIEEATPPPPPFNPAEQVGALPPLDFFDPLGFTSVGDEAGFRNLRNAEIKHGRTAMMACIGAVGQHFVRFPQFQDCKGTFGAALQGNGTLGLVILIAALGALELVSKDDAERQMGNYNDPLGVAKSEFAWSETRTTEDWQNKELSNGRMAMISILGIFGAEVATGKDAIEQFGWVSAESIPLDEFQQVGETAAALAS